MADIADRLHRRAWYLIGPGPDSERLRRLDSGVPGPGLIPKLRGELNARQAILFTSPDAEVGSLDDAVNAALLLVTSESLYLVDVNREHRDCVSGPEILVYGQQEESFGLASTRWIRPETLARLVSIILGSDDVPHTARTSTTATSNAREG